MTSQGPSDPQWPEQGGGDDAGGGGGATPPPQPPAPPAPPGGGVQASSGGLDIGQAFSFGWKAFTENVGPIVIGLLGMFIVLGVLNFVWNAIVGGLFDSGSAGLVIGLVASLVGSLVFTVGNYIVQGLLVRAGFRLVDGGSVDTASFFDTDKIGPIVITGLLVSVGTTIGLILCILPGIVFAIVSGFALHFVVDQDKAPVEAIQASIELFRNQTGPAALLVIATYVVSLAGFLLCGVGALVSFPVALIAGAHGFRQLHGQPVPTA